MNLEQTAMSLLEQFPTAQRANLQRQEQMLERFGQIAFTGFGLVISIAIGAIIYFIITKMILTGVNLWSGILLVAFIIFAGLSLGYVFWAESLKEKRQKLRPQATDVLLEARETGQLLKEGSLEPAISVTENTTELLGIENKTRRL